MISQEKNQKRRMFLIDILRVLCAILIYLRHSVTMYGCTYGHFLDDFFIQITSPVMTCFFILSGFSMHYQHRLEETTGNWTRSFLKKRLITIMPSYLLVVLIWPLVYQADFKKWALLLPVDLLGIQTSYHTLFGILHNGGTWFVSCMLFCYVCYPIMKCVVGSTGKWTPWSVLLITHLVLMYSNVIIPAFSLDRLYSNPIARAGEFLIGVSFSEIVFRERTEDIDLKRKKKGRLVLAFLLVCGISIIIALYDKADYKMMLYGYLVIPIVLVVLFVATLIPSPKLEKSKILAALSGMSYQFFLVQLFLWDLSTWVLQQINMNGNIAKFTISFILCTSISFIIWKYYDKPIRRLLNRRISLNV